MQDVGFDFISFHRYKEALGAVFYTFNLTQINGWEIPGKNVSVLEVWRSKYKEEQRFD